MIDIITAVYGEQYPPTIQVLDQGFVKLIDVMPRLVNEGETCDDAVVAGARVSYGAGTKAVSDTRGLIRYLLRNAHTSPFELCEFKFICKLPIFVARQMIRHRTANVNETSARYSIVTDDYYVPEPDGVRKQSTNNKQASDAPVTDDLATKFITTVEAVSSYAFKAYTEAVEAGIGRELARMILPVNTYTSWVWKMDLHNLLHFLSLRCDSHAQAEIRVFADAILKLITPLAPLTIEAWNDFAPKRGAITLTALEVEALQAGSTTLGARGTPREQAEYDAKRSKLFTKPV